MIFRRKRANYRASRITLIWTPDWETRFAKFRDHFRYWDLSDEQYKRLKRIIK